MDYSKFDSMMDLEGLKKDIADAASNESNREYKDVPHGDYEVAISKLELTETKKTGKPMVSCWMKIVSEGEYKGQIIFMNQVVASGWQIHIANQFLKSLLDGADDAPVVTFESFSQYADLLMDIGEFIDGRFEYGLEYGENSKGFNTFAITDIFALD